MAIDKSERIPPKKAQENASKGLELRKEWGRGGLSPDEAREQGIDSGVTRARQIVSGNPLSEETIKKMAAFNRHRRNYQPDKRESDGGQTAGTIAWLLWGGTAGIDWAIRISKKIDESKGDNMNIERKVVDFKLSEAETKQLTDEEYSRYGIKPGLEVFTFKGYGSTFGNVDRGGDVVMIGAFAETITEMKNEGEFLPALWQHNWDEPIGKYINIYEDSKGLYVEGVLPLTDSFVKERVIPQMEVGSVRKMSIGYVTTDSDYKENIRYIKSAMLYEVSLVTIPMNNSANVTEMKSVVPFQDLPLADRARAWDSDEAIARVREFLDSTDEPSEEYKRAFLWYDRENQDNYGAYKLPIADVVQGKLTAIPRAIFAAAAALSGARGGVDIPENERNSVVNNINRYYQKMGLDSPFDDSKGFRIDDFSVLSEKDLEKLLRKGVYFYKESAKALVSAIKQYGLREGVPFSDREDSDTTKNADLLTKILSEIKSMKE